MQGYLHAAKGQNTNLVSRQFSRWTSFDFYQRTQRIQVDCVCYLWLMFWGPPDNAERKTTLSMDRMSDLGVMRDAACCQGQLWREWDPGSRYPCIYDPAFSLMLLKVGIHLLCCVLTLGELIKIVIWIFFPLEFCGLDKVPHPHHQRVDWVPLSKKAIKVYGPFSPKFSCILNQWIWPSVSLGNSETFDLPFNIFLLKWVNIKVEKDEGIRDHGEQNGTRKQSFAFVLVLSGVAADCGPMFSSMQHFTISTLVYQLGTSSLLTSPSENPWFSYSHFGFFWAYRVCTWWPTWPCLHSILMLLRSYFPWFFSSLG